MQATVVVIGAGQAGLAMSHCLTRRSIDHVVLERGEVANAWRTERWDSLRLLTPNWCSRLPGWHYRGDDPDGYMTAAEVAGHLAAYGRHAGAPVVSNTTVESVRPGPSGFVVDTDAGRWSARSVVVATGAAGTPRIPAVAESLPSRITQVTPTRYRNPGQLDDGGVLVVGASASGLQLADELVRTGRPVTVAVGDHIRLPRTYRGMDIHWWMDTIGLLGETLDQIPDIRRARRLPSLQLVGTPERRSLDLNTLHDLGVDVVGRLVGIRDGSAQFAGSLANLVASADLKLGRLLDRIDAHATAHGLDDEVGPVTRPAPTTSFRDASNVVGLDRFSTVVWATGFRPDYPWLPAHLLDPRGAIRHDGGVMTEPGMYVLGLPVLRRRSSSFLDGVGADAEALATHLARFLGAKVGSRRPVDDLESSRSHE